MCDEGVEECSPSKKEAQMLAEFPERSRSSRPRCPELILAQHRKSENFFGSHGRRGGYVSSKKKRLLSQVIEFFVANLLVLVNGLLSNLSEQEN